MEGTYDSAYFKDVVFFQTKFYFVCFAALGVIDLSILPDAVLIGDVPYEHDFVHGCGTFPLIRVLDIGLKRSVGVLGHTQPAYLHTVSAIVTEDLDLGVVFVELSLIGAKNAVCSGLCECDDSEEKRDN